MWAYFQISVKKIVINWMSILCFQVNQPSIPMSCFIWSVGKHIWTWNSQTKNVPAYSKLISLTVLATTLLKNCEFGNRITACVVPVNRWFPGAYKTKESRWSAIINIPGQIKWGILTVHQLSLLPLLLEFKNCRFRSIYNCYSFIISIITNLLFDNNAKIYEWSFTIQFLT